MFTTACTGEIRIPVPGAADPLNPVDPSNPLDPLQPETPALPAVVELRRLTRGELDLTLMELVGDTSHAALTLLPGEELTPFDNDYAKQQASAVWVEAAERLVEQVVGETLASPARTARIMPCTPTGNDDVVCLAQFTKSFGRRALHRPLSDEEVTELTSLHALARQRGTIMTSVSLVMKRLLLDPELLFRVETGTATADGAVALDAYALASRLSFFVLGRAPDTSLLDVAAAGGLSTPHQVREVARGLLDSSEGRARVEVFHAMWLGYLSLPHDAMFNQRAATETSALVRKVVFEDKADYRTLLTFSKTFVDDTMAAHYGLTPAGTAGPHWLDYGATGRQGILSHAALLSNGTKQTDTSPTLRGKWIRNRLFCQEIAPPPPNVTADEPPPETAGAVCKKQRYAAHDEVQSCAGCHLQMDPIGFGLEQFDRTGRFRSAEAAHPECAITGEGKLAGIGDFVGPKGLSDLMVEKNTLDQCLVTQVFRFGTGRREAPADGALLRELSRSFAAKGRRFDELVLDYVSHPTFAQKKEAL
ncbi:MAG: DUF1588 domain-containing protein [Myxococcaceae bacterium]|nr:DUF1588 domain-containing protein [Myxococcaceae bacterium]